MEKHSFLSRRKFLKYAGVTGLWTMSSSFLQELALTADTFSIQSGYGIGRFKPYGLRQGGQGLEISFTSDAGALLARYEFSPHRLTALVRGQEGHLIQAELKSSVPFTQIIQPERQPPAFDPEVSQDPKRFAALRQAAVASVEPEQASLLRHTLQVDQQVWQTPGEILLDLAPTNPQEVESVQKALNALERTPLAQTTQAFNLFMSNLKVKQGVEAQLARWQNRGVVAFAAKPSCIIGIVMILSIPIGLGFVTGGVSFAFWFVTSHAQVIGTALGCAGL